MKHRIVHVERVTPPECFGAEATLVDEMSAEVNCLQMVTNFTRQARLEHAQRTAVIPRLGIFDNEFLQVPQARKPI